MSFLSWVATSPKKYLAPDNPTPGSTDQTVFTLKEGEIGYIQNLSADAPLAVRYAAGASSTAFHYVLCPGTVTDDGKGGFIYVDDFTGIVSVAKMAGTARYAFWKKAVA